MNQIHSPFHWVHIYMFEMFESKPDKWKIETEVTKSQVSYLNNSKSHSVPDRRILLTLGILTNFNVLFLVSRQFYVIWLSLINLLELQHG